MACEFIKQNKKFLILMIITVEVITILPTIYGYAATPPGFRFNGMPHLTPGDFHLYLSYFEQAKQGFLVFRDLYTGEEQVPIIFNPFFLIFGLIGKIFNLSNIAIHHLARIVLIPPLTIALFVFFSRTFKEKMHIRLAMLLAAFSSGLGFYAAPFFQNNPDFSAKPMDLWVPEFNIFLTVLRNPLYIAALTLIILTFLAFIKAIEKNQIKWSIAAGLAAFSLFLIHPYHVLTIYAIPLTWIISLIIINKKIDFSHLKHFIVLFFISVTPAIYIVYLTLTDLITHNRYGAVSGAPPVVWVTLISYGFLFFLAIPSGLSFLKKFLKKQTDEIFNGNILSFCLLWIIIGFILVYFPLFMHGRRLTLGLEIPLVVFSTLAMINIQNTNWHRRLKKIIDTGVAFLIFFILFFAPSNIYALISNFQVYANKYYEVVYTPNEIYQALNWLKNNTIMEQDVVLSSLYYGNLIPGIIGRTVYVGHSPETAFFNLKERWLFAFFAQNRSENFELKFLKDNRITYIFYTPDLEKSGTWRPENKTYLSKVFENDRAAIYVVR